ncbi:MAG: hypothetical protein KBT68_10110, partial [bacterium]|nr:hypothetical protein [Candidatus Colisoma equi]
MEISFSGAVCTGGGLDPVVLKFISSGDLTLPGDATADLLVVGGGGGGGRSKNDTSFKGGCGGAVVEALNRELFAGDYAISIGGGGAGSSKNGNNGVPGSSSSFVGLDYSLRADGGDEGKSSKGGTPADGIQSQITGETYGKGGKSFSSASGGDNTGNGGGGNKKGSSAGAGGSGVVVVRITDIVPPPYIDYGTNTMVLRPWATSSALEVTSAAKAPWTFWSEDVSVATVSKAMGAEAKAESFTITAGVTEEDKVTCCVASNKYAKYTFKVKVQAPKVDVDMGSVRFSHDETVMLTNTAGEAILWSGMTDALSSDERIAKVVNIDGKVSLTNEVRDGSAEIVIETAKTNYIYSARCMTVRIEKTVKTASETDPNNKSNATICVTSHVLMGVTDVPTNDIIFVGSNCRNHNLVQSTVSEAINTLATKGNVDWFIYDHGSSEVSQTGYLKAGAVPMGRTVTGLPALGSSTHYNLAGYLTILNERLDPPKTREWLRKYDYVVLEFDGNRLAHNLASTESLRQLAHDVAEKLAWYYENNRVIWIVDNVSSSTKDPSYIAGQYYRPTTLIISSSTFDMDDETWDLFVALVDPAAYLAGKTRVDKFTDDAGDHWTATRNGLQAFYDDVESVKKILDQHVKAATYESELVDTVQSLNSSLKIVTSGSDNKHVHFYTWAGNNPPVAPPGGTIADLPNDDAHWKREPESAYTVDGYCVSANITNIVMETWNKFEIEIVDNGTFLRTCLQHDIDHPEEPKMAEWDEGLGRWRVDPNDGAAEVTLYVVEGKERVKAGAAALTTMVKWNLETGSLGVNAVNAEKVYDGLSTNIVVTSVTNQYGALIDDVQLEYYTISSDGSITNVVTGFTDVTNVTVFVKATAVGFADAMGSATVTVTARPVTLVSGDKTDFVYDGAPHAYTNLAATGFVAGEGLATTASWATVTTVAEGEVDNAFAYTLADGTLADNYEITV